MPTICAISGYRYRVEGIPAPAPSGTTKAFVIDCVLCNTRTAAGARATAVPEPESIALYGFALLLLLVGIGARKRSV